MSKSPKKKPASAPARPIPAASPADRRPIPAAATLNVPTSAPVMQPAITVPATTGGVDLIRFDKRLKWLLGICAGVFVLLLLAKIHFISVAAWNQVLPDGSNPRRGLISGEARRIRMDDYTVGTPWFLSQADKGFPQVNETIGGEKAPVLVIPTKHFSSLFKPGHWGAFLFGPETAFVWGSDITIFLALIALTCLFLLLTHNNFWLSLTGAAWLLLSSGTQSWMYIPVQSLTGISMAFVAAIYVLYSTNRRHIIVAALVLAWSLVYFALTLYPPYQVPLVYAMAALFIGYLLNTWDAKRLLTNLPIKLVGVVLAVGVLGSVFYAFYADMKPTLDAIINTVYPGKRNELGGTGFIANWYSEYFSWYTSDAKFPTKWLNHCELSHYLTFAPIILPALVVTFTQKRRIDWPLLLLGCCILFLLAYIELGFPEWLAKATLLNMSPTRRTQIPLGIANVFLMVLYVDYLTKNTFQGRQLYTVLGVLAVFAFMIYAGSVNIAGGEGFFKWHQLFLPIAFFTAMGALLLPTIRVPYRATLFCVGITLFLLPNLGINPVAKGLSPITDHALYQAVRTLYQQEPNARWVVFGNQFVTYMVTATGAPQLSGVKYIPPRNIYKVLDPQMKRDSAYNRYAHTVYSTYINGTDSVYIQNNFEDGCVVAMDPCSPRFKTLNVKYVIFDHPTQPVETRCMKLVTELGSIKIYRINE